MRYALISLLAVTLSLALPTQAGAQSSRTQTRDVYVFALARCFTDSSATFTPVTLLRGATVTDKTGFLVSRNAMALRYKHYLETRTGLPQVCAVFYDTKRDRLEKKVLQLRHLYTRKGSALKVSESDFTDFTGDSAAPAPVAAPAATRP